MLNECWLAGTLCLCVLITGPPLVWLGVLTCLRLRLWALPSTPLPSTPLPSPALYPTPALGTQWAPAGWAQGLEVEPGCCPVVRWEGTSARGAAMRSMPAACGDSLFLWREKRGLSSLLLLCPEEGLSREVKDAATIAPLCQHAAHSPYRPGGGTAPLPPPTSVDQKAEAQINICLGP